MGVQNDTPPFEVERTEAGGRIVVRPVGELDIATAPTLHEAMSDALGEGRPVTLDMGGLTFIDSTGLHLLVVAAKRSRAEGIDFTMIRGHENVHRPIEVCGLAAVLPFSPNGS